MISVVRFTQRASNHIKSLMKHAPENTWGMKFGIKSGGCSGFEYTFKYIEKPQKFDELVKANDVNIAIDSLATMHIIGTEIDYEDSLIRNGFTFKNPNADHSCGCGKSFG